MYMYVGLGEYLTVWYTRAIRLTFNNGYTCH